MHVVRKAQAPAYEAPGHMAMAMRRLQGREAGPADSLWIGLSVIAPGGGTTLSASAVDQAVALAHDAGAKITFVAAVEPFHVLSTDPKQVADTRAVYDRHAKERAAAYLADAERKAKAKGNGNGKDKKKPDAR